MSTFDIDFVDNNDAVKTKDGYKFTRMATLTNIDFASGTTYSGILYSAINDPLVPQIGAAHPALGSCYVERVRAISIEPDYIQLEITYSTLAFRRLSVGDPAQISMQSSLSQIEKSKDYQDAALTAISYTYKSGVIPPWDPGGTVLAEDTTKSETPLVPAFESSRVYTVRKKVALTEAQLESQNETYQNRVNSAQWRAYPVRTWLCLGITWDSDDGGDTFNVIYQFQYKEDTWDFTVKWFDPWTGKLPDDVDNSSTQPNAVKSYRVIKEADFTALDLT